MVCKRCNEEIEDGRVYCPKCGLELHYVPDYNEVDEELDKNMKDLTKDVANENAQQNGEDDEDWEEFHLVKEMTPKQKKMQIIAKITAMSAFIVVLIVCVISYFVIQSRNNSFDVQLSKASKYVSDNNFSKAVVSYENAINKAKTSAQKAAAAKQLGLFYADNSDTKNAVYYLELAVDNNCLDTDLVKTLVGLYELQGNSDSIKKLAKVASNDETYSVFEKYLLNQPVFNYKSGTYNEYLSVEITSENNETIHYTLDDSPATTESGVYEGPIEVKDGTTVIHAITVNENNLVSEEIVTTYVVQSVGGMKPVISPDSGEYTDFTKITIDDISANCKIYYTIDGTEPDENSTEYTQPFEMPVGNHVVKAVSINTDTKVKSEVVSKIYNLDISSKYDTSKAIQYVMTQLQKRNEVLNSSGAKADGTSCVLQFDEEVSIASQNYYIMHKYTNQGGQLIDTNVCYAVNISNGDVFLANKVKDGIYNLDVF